MDSFTRICNCVSVEHECPLNFVRAQLRLNLLVMVGTTLANGAHRSPVQFLRGLTILREVAEDLGISEDKHIRNTITIQKFLI